MKDMNDTSPEEAREPAHRELRVFMHPGCRPRARTVQKFLRYFEKHGFEGRSGCMPYRREPMFVVAEDDSPLEDGYVPYVPRRRKAAGRSGICQPTLPGS